MSGSQQIAPQVTKTRSKPCGCGTAFDALYKSASTKRARSASPSSAARPRAGDRRSRKIETDHLGTALRQRQTVGAEMALQVQDAFASDGGQLRLFDRM